ncbi:hypothetical protein RND71_040485 [Anisodus tanguticus]|uniref:Uncharacterized protein n=1 Tax=Anisodus tanguticus TaxID=243964 RepID=A0AAE1UNZ6_9SOLA|nr:hypothetical protein RND71_040485 [Anisodus tanguticus]
MQGCSIRGYRGHKSEQVGASLLLRLMGGSSHLDDRQVHFFIIPLRDVFYTNLDEVLPGATVVVSTLGGFGSDKQMQRINGEANVVAVNAAKDYELLMTSLEFIRATESFTKPLNSLPASDLVLAPPVIVDDAAINAVKDDDCFGIFTIDQIKEAAK